MPRRPRIRRIIRKARRGFCAKRWARRSGSIPDADRLRHRLGRPPAPARACLSRRGRRGDRRPARLPRLSDRDHGERRQAVIVPEKITRRMSTHCSPPSRRRRSSSIANPNNPTGTYLPFDEVKRLQRGLPPHVLLVIDAAYAEYVDRNDYEAGIELVAHHRERGDVPDVLEDPRPRLAPGRLDVCARAHHRRDQPDPRTVQRLDAGDAGSGRLACRHGQSRRMRARTTSSGAAG